MSDHTKLTRAERAWIKELQDVLDRCPSQRLAFSASGDRDLMLHDATREHEISAHMEEHPGEWRSAATEVGADFGGVHVVFPGNVHSVAG